MIRGLASAARRRAARAAGGRESGISLVELLVSMMIFAIILTMVASMYSSMSRTVALGSSANQTTKLASSAMSEVSRVIRFATTNAVVNHPAPDAALVVADTEALTVYSYVDANAATPKPIKIAFTVDASRRLVESRYSATLVSGFWQFTTPTAYSTRIITDALGTPSGAELPLFSYQLIDGSTLTVPVGGLTAATAATVAAVQVRIKVKSTTGSGGQPVILQSTIGMSNLGLNRTGQ